MREAIKELENMVRTEGTKDFQKILIVDALGAMAAKIEEMESEIRVLREMKNGGQKTQTQSSGFNIG